MSGALLTIAGVGKCFGSFRALQAIDLDIGPGERLGIIGPNGSGKTTLINCVAGTLIADEGAIRLDGQDVTRMPAHRRARLGIARSFQIPQPFAGMSVIENLLVPLDYLSHGGDARSRAAAVLDSVGLAGRRDDPAELLTQLELRKLELARALVGRPRLLIADEAMAGLSDAEIDEVLAILAALNESGVAIIMIEHIMHAVMRFSRRIICLDAGRLVAAGSPREVANNPDVQRVYFGERARR
jgi:branched-chain amino acid transport system ATP-binding protein